MTAQITQVRLMRAGPCVWNAAAWVFGVSWATRHASHPVGCRGSWPGAAWG